MQNFIDQYEEAPDVVLVFPIGYDRDALSVQVSDDSYRNRQMMGDHDLTLHFSFPGYVDIPIGTVCRFQGEKYTLEEPMKFTKKGVREYNYTLIMQSTQFSLRKYKLRNTVPGDTRLKFSYTAKPQEFLKLIVDNLNLRDGGWSIGEGHIESSERTVSFNHSTCMEALSMVAEAFDTEWEVLSTVAEAFDTEWEVRNKAIYLRKVEHNIDNPLTLSYGQGNGFKSGVSKSKFGDKNPLEVLYVQGGERNIDTSKYGNRELLLPRERKIKFDGFHFDDEPEFNPDTAREYITDTEGYSVRRADKELFTQTEDSLDLSEIYPKRVGTITKVDVVNKDKNFYDFTDNTIPSDLDYSKQLIDGETMTVIFQTGMLTGKEFDVKYIHKDRRFEIVPQEIDGQTMPNKVFAPVEGGEYAIFGMNMPDRYIEDASVEMLKEAVKYFYENEVAQFSFMGEMDGLWARRDWTNIGGKIVLGGYINFSDTQFLKEGALIRIVGIVDYINNPHSPKIELDNRARHSTWMYSAAKRIKQEEVVSETRDKEVVQYAKRRFRNVKETMEMLSESMLNFSEGINPITVQAMQMVVGDESLQFEYSRPSIDFDFKPENGMTMFAPAGVLTHKTLEVGFISSSGAEKNYLKWDLEGKDFTPDDPSGRYYLYARVVRGGTTGTFVLRETAIKMEDEGGYYHLLVGLLNSEYEGDRDFVPMYGFTEITPGRITTDLIKSAQGDSFMDLANNKFRIGDANSALDWNNKTSDALTIENANIKMVNDAGETMINLDGKDGSGVLAGGGLSWDNTGNMVFASNQRDEKIVIDSTDRSLKLIDANGYVTGEWSFETGGVSRLWLSTPGYSTLMMHPGVVSFKTSEERYESSFTFNSLFLQTRNKVGNGMRTASFQVRVRYRDDGYPPNLDVIMIGLPTSKDNLNSGTVWRDGEVLKIVP